MTPFRNGVAIAYAILLLIVGLLSLYAIEATWRAYNDAVTISGENWLRDFGWRVFPQAVSSAALLLLTLAYAHVFARKGLNLAMPFIYVLTCAFIVFVFYLVFTGSTKDDRGLDYLLVVVGGLGVIPIFAGVFGYLLNYRYFRPTFLNAPQRRKTVKPWW
jgi:hypothetical protein